MWFASLSATWESCLCQQLTTNKEALVCLLALQDSTEPQTLTDDDISWSRRSEFELITRDFSCCRRIPTDLSTSVWDNVVHHLQVSDAGWRCLVREWKCQSQYLWEMKFLSSLLIFVTVIIQPLPWKRLKINATARWRWRTCVLREDKRFTEVGTQLGGNFNSVLSWRLEACDGDL